MSHIELTRYEALLELKEIELAGRLGNRDGIAIEKTADALDEVQSAGEREMAIRDLHRQSDLRRKVRGALARLARGTFGSCLRCEQEINPKRLTAAPWSAYCIECQEAADRHEFETTEDVEGLLADAA